MIKPKRISWAGYVAVMGTSGMNIGFGGKAKRIEISRKT
jgi:hypothetical protein